MRSTQTPQKHSKQLTQTYTMCNSFLSSVSMNVTNMFGNADAMAAVIWSSCFATLVIIIMVMLQRILNFTEVMTAWIDGVKDVLEPLFILILAWALGAVIAVS